MKKGKHDFIDERLLPSILFCKQYEKNKDIQ